MSSWLPSMKGSMLAFPAIELGFLSLFAITILHVSCHAVYSRLINLIILSVLTYMVQQAFFESCENPHWRAGAAPLAWIQLLSASDLILVTRVDSNCMPAYGGRSTVKTTVAETKQVIGLLWNLRRVGTKWQVKNIPINTNSDCTPWGRFRFISVRLITTLLACLVLDIMTSAPSPDLALASPQKQTLVQLRSLSSEDIVFRVIGTASFWLSTYLINLVMANSVAILCVGTGISSAKNCPPLYGSLGEAYSIRQFWGVSWHQCLRRGLTGHAGLITSLMPFIPESTMLSRYTRLFLAFLVSGLIHHSSDLAMGIPRAEAGSLAFFLLQPLGIIIEDGVQKLTESLPSLRLFGRVRLQQIVGYVWVMTFLVWTTPTWFYPQQRIGLDPTGLLPFHLSKPLLSQFQRWFSQK